MVGKYLDIIGVKKIWNELINYIENKKEVKQKVFTSAVINKNTNYAVPKYTLGDDSLNIFFEGCKLVKDVNYTEKDTTHIQFKDWDVPKGSNLEFIIRK